MREKKETKGKERKGKRKTVSIEPDVVRDNFFRAFAVDSAKPDSVSAPRVPRPSELETNTARETSSLR